MKIADQQTCLFSQYVSMWNSHTKSNTFNSVVLVRVGDPIQMLLFWVSWPKGFGASDFIDNLSASISWPSTAPKL